MSLMGVTKVACIKPTPSEAWHLKVPQITFFTIVSDLFYKGFEISYMYHECHLLYMVLI